MPLTLEVVPEKAIVIRRQRDKRIVCASWFGPNVLRPHFWPFLGPYDSELVRIGHPGDPVGHSHHRGIFIAHHDIDGVDFWSEKKGVGRVVQTGVSEVISRGKTVSALCAMSWRRPASSGKDGVQVLREKRRMTFSELDHDELALDLDITLEADNKPVVLGKTNFGVLGIRVAKTIRVHEGLGGRVTNSSEAENEAGCFGQHATWCDYSGPVPLQLSAQERKTLPRGALKKAVPVAIVGIACFDHPENAKGDTAWHVRDDGWMGPGLCREAARTLRPGRPLTVRYRILAHHGDADRARLGERYRSWAR